MAFSPIFMKDVDLILGDEAAGPNFKCELKSVVLTPDTNIVRDKALCPSGQYAEVEDPEWSLDLGYLVGVHDDEAEALGDFLMQNKGDKVGFIFRPRAGGPGYSGRVTLVAGAIGGEQGSFSNQSVSLPLDGQPAPVAAAAGGGA